MSDMYAAVRFYSYLDAKVGELPTCICSFGLPFWGEGHTRDAAMCSSHTIASCTCMF